MENEKKFVTYEQFGATGDGVTDDFEAIVAAHAYANEHKLPVRAADGATYLIKKGGIEATVMTDVEWGTAKFVIENCPQKILLSTDETACGFFRNSEIVPAGYFSAE